MPTYDEMYCSHPIRFDAREAYKESRDSGLRDREKRLHEAMDRLSKLPAEQRAGLGMTPPDSRDPASVAAYIEAVDKAHKMSAGESAADQALHARTDAEDRQASKPGRAATGQAEDHDQLCRHGMMIRECAQCGGSPVKMSADDAFTQGSDEFNTQRASTSNSRGPQNPHPPGSPMAVAWDSGWQQARNNATPPPGESTSHNRPNNHAEEKSPSFGDKGAGYATWDEKKLRDAAQRGA